MGNRRPDLGSAIRQASLPAVLLDSSCAPSAANRAFEEMFRRISGRPLDEMGGSLLVVFGESDETGQFALAFSELMAGKRENAVIDGPFKTASNDRIWLRTEMSAVGFRKAKEGGSGESRFVLCAFTDITGLMQKERMLLEAKEEAERTTNTKSQFLANMSHEIRTPIQTITGMTELLMETQLDGEQREYAKQVEFSADVLLSLINDILDFSKIEAGKLTLEIIDFDLNAVIEEAIDLVVLEAHRKGLEVLVDIDAGVPRFLRGDPIRIRQILVNLIKNAVKFTTTGEIEVSASEKAIDGVENVFFVVRDTGIGISEEVRGKLFSTFFQADSSTTRQYGGTGLGLSITKHLVGLMSGKIGFQDIASAGSSFWFHIPAIPSATPKEVNEIRFKSDTRVLVTDDNDRARRIIRKYLEEAGAAVVEASSGAEALRALSMAAREENQFSACLVDLLMPGMDGWRLASAVNADKSINNAKLILMSPQGTTQTEAKMKLLRWFNGYIMKPVKRDDLLDCVNRVISNLIELEGIEEREDGLAETESLIPVGRRILIAEDHPINQQLFTVILNKLGHAVTVASDGQEAVQCALSEPYDLIFLDIQMPRMNGYEAATAIRNAGISVPIIALTASAVKGEKERCLEAGMDDILTKPFKRKDIVAILAARLPEEADMTKSAASVSRRPDLSVIDFREAVETFLGNREMVVTLLKKFMEKAAGQLKSIDDAMASGDLNAVEREAHSIKGSAWNLAAKAMGDAAATLDAAAKADDKAGVASALASLKDAFEQLKAGVAYYTANGA